MPGTDGVVYPFITVVMPVYNEERFIEQTLFQLLAQKYPTDRYEILVVDGMSIDNTRAIVQALAHQYPQIRLLDNPKRKSSSGRNVGFKNGRGDYFLVVDGHCHIPTTQLLANVAECFRISNADCLGRPQPLAPPGLSPFQQAVALARDSRLGHGSDSLIYSDYEGFASPVSNGAAYARHVFAQVGYVDETFDACEDVEFNYRVEQAGLTCYTSPKLTIHYYPRENLRALWRQMARYGAGRLLFISRHPEALTIYQLIPASFIVGILLTIACPLYGVLLGGAGVFAGKIIVAIYIGYVIILLLESFRVSPRNNRILFFRLTFIFLTIHAGLGWGFLMQALISLHRVHLD